MRDSIIHIIQKPNRRNRLVVLIIIILCRSFHFGQCLVGFRGEWGDKGPPVPPFHFGKGIGWARKIMNGKGREGKVTLPL